jgi:hypothetical protein
MRGRDVLAPLILSSPFSLSKENLPMVAQDWEQASLKNMPSYHWKMSSKNAVSQLKQSEERRCYLLRYNSQRNTFKLTVKGTVLKGKRIVFEHYSLLIKQNSDGNTYQIQHKEKTFKKLSDLLAYYEKNPIGYRMKNIGVPVVYDQYSRPASAYLLPGGQGKRETKVWLNFVCASMTLVNFREKVDPLVNLRT